MVYSVCCNVGITYTKYTILSAYKTNVRKKIPN